MPSEIVLKSAAWFGDSPTSLGFPPSWDVTVLGGCGDALSVEGMRERLKSPIASKPLSEIAAGKRRIAIVVDDLTRPTPASKLLPLVLEELAEGGVEDGSVTVVIGGGTHSLPTREEIGKKVGEELAARLTVHPHDPVKDLVFLGVTSRGTPIHLNRTIHESDLVIGMGCIYPHPAAGFSGGSKIIAPGVCGIETVRYMHDYLRGGERGKIGEGNEFRSEIEEIAAKSGLRFIVNAVLNQEREVCGLFAGERVQAHRAGVAFARQKYSVKPVAGADVVIVDAYPFDTTFQFAHDRSLWQFSGTKTNVSKVIVASCPAGLGNHELYPLVNPLWTRLARRVKHFQWREFRNSVVKFNAVRKLLLRRKQDYIIFSAGLTREDVAKIYPRSRLFGTWERVIRELESIHGNGAVKVCIYRCAPFLMPARGNSE